jgi:RNA polymerase sigma factor (sigma-70 family)
MTDDDFIRAVLSGDGDAEACFQEIYINGIVRAKIRDRYPWLKSEAEDICQDMWLYFKERDWRFLRNFLALENRFAGLRAYLCTTVVRFIVKKYRNKFGCVIIPLIFDEDDETDPMQKVAAPEPNPDRALENKILEERIEYLTALLFDEVLVPGSPSGLSEREQKIFRMRCVMRLHAKETAEMLGMHIGAVDTALSRAKKKIRDFYEDRGLSNEVREVLRDVAGS